MAKTRRVSVSLVLEFPETCICSQYQLTSQVQVKKRTHLPQPEAQGKQRPPKTFVFWRGKHGVRVMQNTFHTVCCGSDVGNEVTMSAAHPEIIGVGSAEGHVAQHSLPPEGQHLDLLFFLLGMC